MRAVALRMPNSPIKRRSYDGQTIVRSQSWIIFLGYFGASRFKLRVAVAIILVLRRGEAKGQAAKAGDKRGFRLEPHRIILMRVSGPEQITGGLGQKANARPSPPTTGWMVETESAEKPKAPD